MTERDVLYKETLVRVGPDEMRGVNRLLDNGHTGIAEKHTVSKLLIYIRGLEKQLGVDVPRPDDDIADRPNLTKFNIGGSVYFGEIGKAA